MKLRVDTVKLLIAFLCGMLVGAVSMGLAHGIPVEPPLEQPALQECEVPVADPVCEDIRRICQDTNNISAANQRLLRAIQKHQQEHNW